MEVKGNECFRKEGGIPSFEWLACHPMPAVLVPEQSILKNLQTSKGLLLLFASAASAMGPLPSDCVSYKTVEICGRNSRVNMRV